MGALAQQYVGDWLSTLIDLVVLLDSISVALAFTVTGSRVFFALSRDGLLPKFVGSTSSRNTPLGGNVVILVRRRRRADPRPASPNSVTL